MKHFNRLIIASFLCLIPLIGKAEFTISQQTPLLFKGTGESLRTVWFSPDNTQVFGDFQHIYGWDIATKYLILNRPVQGYSVFPSAINDTADVWLRGSSLYQDNDKKDMSKLYSVVSIAKLKLNKVSHRPTQTFDVWKADFIKRTQQAVLIINTKVDYKTFFPSLVIYDLDTNQLIDKIHHGKPSDVMTSVKITPNTRYVAVSYAGLNARVEIYDFKSRKKLKTFNTQQDVDALAISNEHLFFNTGSTVHRINLKSHSLDKSYKSLLKTASVLALSPDGQSIAIAGQHGASVIDLASKNITNLSNKKIMSLAFSPNGQMLALGHQLSLHAKQSASLEIWVNQQVSNKPKKTIIKKNTPDAPMNTPWWDNI